MAEYEGARRVVDMTENDLANLVDARIEKVIGAKEAEDDLASLVDARIAKAIGIAPKEVAHLEADAGVMSTPSVLSTVRATAAAMC